MTSIYKYQICSVDFGGSINFVEVPKDSTLLKIGVQNGYVVAWYKVDTEEEKKETITWYQIGTGHHCPTNSDIIYFDTVTNSDSSLVWHMFYKK